MTISDLQKRLAALGFYRGKIDGIYGGGTRSALLQCLEAGPDTPMQPADIAKAARLLDVSQAHIRTVRDVEAAGAGFFNGLPKVLFEGHIFSRLTGHKFDRSHPHLSYPKWDRKKYPKTQEARYQQIIDAVGLDPDAAFSAASYGAFQILGQNYKACGYNTPFDFVLAQCQSEGDQLFAFVNFLRTNHLDDELRDGRWAEFARGYNGPAYRENAYDTKLKNAYAKQSKVPDFVPPAAPVPAPASPPRPVATPTPLPAPQQVPPPPVIPAAPQPSASAGFAGFVQFISTLLGQLQRKPA